MATAVVMPKQGQSVESCIIVEWKRRAGEPIVEGDILCEVETDKAVLEVPSPVAGTLLELFFAAGEDVPVLTPIAAVGAVGEDTSALRPARATSPSSAQTAPLSTLTQIVSPTDVAQPSVAQPSVAQSLSISPRARNLAAHKGVEISGIQGSGPGGRIIERDIHGSGDAPT